MNPEQVLNLIVELLYETVAGSKGQRVEWNEPKHVGPLARRLVSKCHDFLDPVSKCRLDPDPEFEIRAAIAANETDNLLLSVECAWRIPGGTEKYQIHRDAYEVPAKAEAANLLDIRAWYESQLGTCRERIEVVLQAKIKKIGR